MNTKPYRIVDLYCSAGGASKGYHDAGFEVVGVDLYPQPHYPFEFVQMDAFEFYNKYWSDFDIVAASPPCQEYTKSAIQWRKSGKKYPDDVNNCRNMFLNTGQPYIIENVPGAQLIDPIFLNGSYFGLLVHRPRYFECSFFVDQPVIPKTKRPVKMGRPVEDGDIIQPVGHFSGVEYAKRQMEIDWMTGKELSQAIPPAYTKYIGEYAIRYLNSKDPDR